MADLNLSKTVLSDMANIVEDFAVSSMVTEGPSEQDETYYTNSNWPAWFGYYKTIPELKKAVDALAIWVLGQGYNAEPSDKVILDHITGWGEDTFTSVLWNMLVVSMVAGDSFAEIIRDKGTGMLINLRPLDPGSIRIVVNRQGVIKRYEQMSKVKKPDKIFQPAEILHLCNDRVADEIHGVSVVEACKWVIDARNEAMEDWRRILHRSTIRVMYIDADDTDKLEHVKLEYATAIKNGELMLIPAKKGEAEFQDLVVPPIDAFLKWIQYNENFFYQTVGIPKVIASSENYTEASSKVGYLTFEPVYTSKQVELEGDLWNQLKIKIKFNRPPSLAGAMQRSEAKNTVQTGFQPNDVQAGVGE
jgi:hypothetical protein